MRQNLDYILDYSLPTVPDSAASFSAELSPITKQNSALIRIVVVVVPLLVISYVCHRYR
jgi:hypothetical protein